MGIFLKMRPQLNEITKRTSESAEALKKGREKHRISKIINSVTDKDFRYIYPEIPVF